MCACWRLCNTFGGMCCTSAQSATHPLTLLPAHPRKVLISIYWFVLTCNVWYYEKQVYYVHMSTFDETIWSIWLFNFPVKIGCQSCVKTKSNKTKKEWNFLRQLQCMCTLCTLSQTISGVKKTDFTWSIVLERAMGKNVHGPSVSKYVTPSNNAALPQFLLCTYLHTYIVFLLYGTSSA